MFLKIFNQTNIKYDFSLTLKLTCIKYNVKLKNLSSYDVKLYIKKHSSLYTFYLIMFLVGVFFAVAISMSSNEYLKLLTKDNKILYSIINGTHSVGKLFWKELKIMIMPTLLVFLTSLSFYTSFFSFLIIAYQGAILTLSIFALVSTYTLSGVLNSLFLVLPINLLYIFILIIFASGCFKRSKEAKRVKKLSYGFKTNEFLYLVIFIIISIFIIAFIGSIIVPLFLKNAIFIFF